MKGVLKDAFFIATLLKCFSPGGTLLRQAVHARYLSVVKVAKFSQICYSMSVYFKGGVSLVGSKNLRVAGIVIFSGD
jgi:hypothetical protein